MSINRRNFLHLSTGLCLASALPSVQLNAQIEKKMNELKIERVTVNLGLEKPFPKSPKQPDILRLIA